MIKIELLSVSISGGFATIHGTTAVGATVEYSVDNGKSYSKSSVETDGVKFWVSYPMQAKSHTVMVRSFIGNECSNLITKDIKTRFGEKKISKIVIISMSTLLRTISRDILANQMKT